MNAKLDWHKLSAEQAFALFELEQLVHGTFDRGYSAVDKCDELKRSGQDVSMIVPVQKKVLAGLTAYGASLPSAVYC